MRKIIGSLLVTGFVLIWLTLWKEPMIYFWWDGCPACAKQNEYFEDLQEEYDFELKKFEVYYSKDNQELMKKYWEVLWEDLTWIPAIIMWDDHFVWADYNKTEELIQKYAVNWEESSIDHDAILWESVSDGTDDEMNANSKYIVMWVLALLILIWSGFVIFKK